MYPTREFIQYSSSWNILSAYENFTHRGSNFSSTFSSLQQYKLHRAFQPPFSLAIGRAQSPAERGKRKELSFLRLSRSADYFLATVPVFQERDPIDFGGKRFCKRVQEKKVYLFPFSRRGIVNHEAIYLNFSETRYRFLTRIRNTLRHFRFAKRCTMSIDVLPRERYVYSSKTLPHSGWCENDTENSFMGCYNFL